MIPSEKKIKVLHVVAAMNRGGIETWLMNVIRSAPPHFQFDFLVNSETPGEFDEEIKRLGARIFRKPNLDWRKPWGYFSDVRSVLREGGPYDAVHSHMFLFSGITLGIAASAKVPVRIAHCHTTRDVAGLNPSVARGVYVRAMSFLIDKVATKKIGVSFDAGAALFGSQWLSDFRSEILLYGFDFSRFSVPSDIDQLKDAYAIPRTSKIVGHVGRFAPVKNHRFLIEVFGHLHRSHGDTYLLLVGDGPLRGEIEDEISNAGLQNHVAFAGNQADTVPFFQMMNAFVFPSHFEGFGIVALEAQAANVPVIASTALPEETTVVPELVHRKSLEDGANEWAETIGEIIYSEKRKDTESLVAVENSEFSINRCLIDLDRIYQGR